MTNAAVRQSSPMASASGSTTKELRVPSEKMSVRRAPLEILLGEHRALGAYELFDRLHAAGLKI